MFKGSKHGVSILRWMEMKLTTLASESFAAKLCLSANSIRQEIAGIWKRLLGANTKSHSVPTPVGHRRSPKMPFSFICAMVAEGLGKKQICGALCGTLETNDQLRTFNNWPLRFGFLSRRYPCRSQRPRIGQRQRPTSHTAKRALVSVGACRIVEGGVCGVRTLLASR